MEAIVPYMNFNGNAREAMNFYADALEGKIEMIQTFGEAQMAKTDEDKDKILHAVLKAGELTIMSSDCPPGVTTQEGNMISLSLNFDDKAGLEKVFNKLSVDGEITMPLQDTFWGAYFGMLKDKFGNSWMFNHDMKPKDHA